MLDMLHIVVILYMRWNNKIDPLDRAVFCIDVNKASFNIGMAELYIIKHKNKKEVTCDGKCILN